MKSLYRRYRPLSLTDVVGQDQVIKPLTKSLETGKISHAYLFIGPRGTGKTSVARIFAHAVNGFPYEIEDDYVDIIEIDGASNRGIDNIRELREKAAIAPTEGKYKIYIIDEVHMLTNEAFNALLKTLEEPPRHVIFIMATTDAYKVPVTITSRAQTFTFTLADANTMLEFLKNVAKQEKIKIDEAALKIIVDRGGGSFRDSLSLLDQISTLSDKQITKEMVVDALGLPSDELIYDLLSKYTAVDIIEITTSLKSILSSGIKPETLAEELLNYIIKEPKPELLPLLAKLPEIKSPFTEAKLLIALMPDVQISNQPVLESSNSAPPKKTAFEWQKYLETIEQLNDVVFSYLKKCEHELRGGRLELFPNNKIAKNILESKNNKKILEDTFGGKVTIAELGKKPSNYVKDTFVDKISDIMGGEVKKDGGENPFD